MTPPARSGPPDRAWQQSESVPILPPDRVQIWLADLDQCGWSGAACLDLLHPTEQARASRFRRELDQRRFAARRAILRHLVGAYTGVDPVAVKLVMDPFGKPGLAQGDWHFNLSVAGELALYGFVRGRHIGVDLTQPQPGFDWREILESFFHPKERTYIRQLPVAEQSPACYRLWTIKEAFVKADGGGLGHPSAREDFTALLREGPGDRGASWRYWGWQPTPASLAAVVVSL